MAGRLDAKHQQHKQAASLPQAQGTASLHRQVSASSWAKRQVSMRFGRRPGFCCSMTAKACLPLPPDVLFELLTHPDNEVFLRNLERCTYRRVLSDDGGGRLVCLVEHETNPDGPDGSLLWAEQAVQPRGLPPLLGGAVRSYVAAQVRCSCWFEDLYAEALRIQAGTPTLPLCAVAISPGCCQPSSSSQEGEEPADPTSVLSWQHSGSSCSSPLSNPNSRSSSSAGSPCASEHRSPFAEAAGVGAGAGWQADEAGGGSSSSTSTSPPPTGARIVGSSAAFPASHPLNQLSLQSSVGSCLLNTALSIPPTPDQDLALPCRPHPAAVAQQDMPVAAAGSQVVAGSAASLWRWLGIGSSSGSLLPLLLASMFWTWAFVLVVHAMLPS